MEPKQSLSCSQEPVTRPYPEPDKYCMHVYKHFLRTEPQHFTCIYKKVTHFIYSKQVQEVEERLHNQLANLHRHKWTCTWKEQFNYLQWTPWFYRYQTFPAIPHSQEYFCTLW